MRGDVVIFFPIHNAMTSVMWTWLLLNQSMAMDKVQVQFKWYVPFDKSISGFSFWVYPQFFSSSHTHTIIPFVPHRITNQKYKIPSRSLFIYFAAKTVSLIFSILFFFPFFFPLINGVSDFKCYTGPPQNQFESLKLSQHQTVKVKMHYCGPAFVTFFNTHVTSL